MTLRDRQRAYFYAQLEKKFPGLERKYMRTFGECYFAPAQNAKRLEALFTELCAQFEIAAKMPFYSPPVAIQASLF
jgi:hypothetical protein